MATSVEPLAGGLRSREEADALASEWRRLARAATTVALLTSPAAFLWLYRMEGWTWYWAALAAFGMVIAFRATIDLVVRRFIPWPSLFGTDDTRLREEDVVNRRRSWFWRQFVRKAFWIGLVITIVFVIELIRASTGESVTWFGAAGSIVDAIWSARTALGGYFLILVVFFFINVLILIGPLMAMGVSQIRGYQPGDADWGVRLEDVRGQAEAKEEVRRIVDLWQSGEAFEQAGGKRERGLLFLGAPGTGKTMLAKAIATGFNSPFVSIPGSGFAQTFIGVDALIVRFLARKARKLARKWGGQCIVFIDEIDAVGMRRSAVQGQAGTMTPVPAPDSFYELSDDLVVETRSWRDRQFAARATERRSPYPPAVHKFGNMVNQMLPGMFGGQGQLALNQLLVTMDGIDNPPFFRRLWTSSLNSVLDALYVVPRRLGRIPLRTPPPRPRREQIYFIGATNVPMNVLDPALTRPGRLGRHVWFRTPTKEDRKDIFQLYMSKVSHEAALDTDERRDEIARITNGYSPAMIEQICSTALTYAHHAGRAAFNWEDLLEAMTVIEAGTAVGVRYVEHETRAVAIHEAGHAAAAHVYRKDLESSRLSIRMRGASLGHHQAFEKEERFSQWQSEEIGALIHTLGAMAAERVFYGENSNGVGGDLQSATNRAAWMVGTAGMGPQPLDLGAIKFADETEEQTRERIMRRFEEIGLMLMNRTRGSADFHGDPVAAILGDPFKRKAAAQILGQAYLTAENFIAANKEPVGRIADVLVERNEIYGDELLKLLAAQRFAEPKIDLSHEESWPRL